jgi:signal recognition particle GTPase
MADSVEDFCYSLESDLQNNTISQEELDDMYSNNQVLQQYKDKEENNKDEENTEEENNEEEESFDADADEDTNENKKEKKPNAIIEKIKKWFNGLNSDSKKTLNYFKKEYPDNFKNFIQDESNKTWFDNGLEQLSPQDYEGFVDLIATTKNIGRVKQLFNDGQEYKDVVLEELTDIVENSTNYTKENINPLQLLTEIENSDISSVFGSSDSMEILKDIYDKNSRYKNMLSGFKDDVETIVKCMKCFYKISNCLSKFDASDPDIANESQYQKDVLKQIENGNYNDDIYRKTFASQKSKRLIQAKFKRLVHK